jgi:hypothetical protein
VTARLPHLSPYATAAAVVLAAGGSSDAVETFGAVSAGVNAVVGVEEEGRRGSVLKDEASSRSSRAVTGVQSFQKPESS